MECIYANLCFATATFSTLFASRSSIKQVRCLQNSNYIHVNAMSPSDILTLATLAVLLLPVHGHRDRHEGTTRQWSLSQTVSFSSPEFLKLLPEMDEKMVPIDHAKVPDEV
eukprot:s3453_g20.t1